jgi:hypothetical protein
MNQLLAVFLGLPFYASPVQPQKPESQPASRAGRNAAAAELVTLTNAFTDAINTKDHAMSLAQEVEGARHRL